MEERQVCQTNFEKDCQPVTVSDCMDVTELRCEVNLFTNCSMDWQMKDSLESLMSVDYFASTDSCLHLLYRVGEDGEPQELHEGDGG